MIKQQIEELAGKIVDLPQEEGRMKASISLINSAVESWANYVGSVANHVIGMTTNRAMFAGGYLDKEDLRYRTETLDRNRRAAHDAAMANMTALNRLCDRYGVKHIAPDTTDRVKLGEFCAIVTVELFMDGTGRSREEVQRAVEAVRKSHDPMTA